MADRFSRRQYRRPQQESLSTKLLDPPIRDIYISECMNLNKAVTTVERFLVRLGAAARLGQIDKILHQSSLSHITRHPLFHRQPHSEILFPHKIPHQSSHHTTQHALPYKYGGHRSQTQGLLMEWKLRVTVLLARAPTHHIYPLDDDFSRGDFNGL